MDDRPGLRNDDLLHHRQPRWGGRPEPARRLVLRRRPYLSFPGRPASYGAGEHRLAAARRRDGDGRRRTDVSPRKPQSAAAAAAPEANQLRDAAGQAHAGGGRDGDHVHGHDDARRAQLAQPQSRAALRQHQSGTQYTAAGARGGTTESLTTFGDLYREKSIGNSKAFFQVISALSHRLVPTEKS